MISGSRKRTLESTKSKGDAVICYLCGKSISRLCDLKGRHFRDSHPNEKYAPPVAAGQSRLFEFIAKKRTTRNEASQSESSASDILPPEVVTMEIGPISEPTTMEQPMYTTTTSQESQLVSGN